ncbi:MAG: extradiol dioxygenase [Jatrophihabitans sp.]|nr:extradiol dioxygenase [Jatrophihabitans sp.]
MTITSIIVTPDLDRMLAFYQGMFDATQTSRFPEDGAVFYVGLKVGDSDLGLVSEDAELGTKQRIVLSFAVSNVDELLDRVVELGGRVMSPPNDMPWGQRVGHIEDPDGNAVNLTHEIARD